MIKHGAVIAGETPSEISGRKSEVIKRGCAVCRGEKPLVAAEKSLQRVLDKQGVIEEDTDQKR